MPLMPVRKAAAFSNMSLISAKRSSVNVALCVMVVKALVIGLLGCHLLAELFLSGEGQDILQHGNSALGFVELPRESNPRYGSDIYCTRT